MVIYGLLLALCLLMTLRSTLIILGVYKDPVLASFEVYGREKIYSPMVWLIIWGLGSTYLSLYLLIPQDNAFIIGIVILIPVLAVRERVPNIVHNNPRFFRSLPAWYRELATRTTREERRRIAYLWLRLPARTRSLYNINNHLFYQWVDLVLMSIAR